MQLVQEIIDYSTYYISKGGIPFGFLLVFIESFIPILPLSVFVALNINAFGFLVGTTISWLATSCGSIICYFFYNTLDQKLLTNIIKKKKLKDKIKNFKKIRFPQLVLIITLPFTPSFLINLLSGLSNMDKRKFIASILIGKLFVIIFWGYIGKSLIESLTDIKSLIYIFTTLLIAYIISKVVSKKMKIE